MASTLILRRSAVPAKVPALADIDLGELAINTADGYLYAKKDDGTPAIVRIGGPLANVALTGRYLDLIGRPDLFDGSYTSLSDVPSTFQPSAHDHTLANIADSGDLAGLNRATVAQIRGFAGDAGLTAERLADAAAVYASPWGTWAPDWSAFVSANWQLNANATLQNPTNIIPGTTRVIRAVSSDATERTISYGSNFKGDLNPGPVTNAEVLLLNLFAYSATEIVVTSMGYET